ncbi:MAG: DNA polymerase IV [Coriobacteriales bacterium]|jgi:DNA polymerase-4|nr:DNA polymerase IV [Coriobacteriales bacterium]
MRSILHIDANSAYLSWTAMDMLERGHPHDYREMPAVVAGDPESRHGIILAKSLSAKRYGISTAMSLYEARKRCPELVVLKPDYELYIRQSRAMYEILYDFSPAIERYSIDECYMDYTASRGLFGDPVEAAHTIKDRIHKELGFTVNIGVSINKLLAKMGSELEKPNKVHTLYPSEMAEKMWPLDVQELFYCGRATASKLRRIGIHTIGEIAQADVATLEAVLKPSHGRLIHNYANGIDTSPVVPQNEEIQKGVGNSTTLPRDVTSKREAHEVLLAIADRVGARLRKLNRSARLIGLVVRSSDLAWYQHQSMLDTPISTTTQIYEEAKRLFHVMWKGEPVRQLGIRLSELCANTNQQLTLFGDETAEKQRALDSTVDSIRSMYGNEAIMRGTLTNVELPSTLADTNDDGGYLMLGAG